MQPMNDHVNITVVTYNRIELTKRCLNSLLNFTAGNFIVNVVDNFSTDGTWDFLTALQKNDSRIKITRFSRNMGVAVAANYGWSLAPHMHYVKLDNDVEIIRGDWLPILLRYVNLHKNIGAIGYKFLEKHKVAEERFSDGGLFWNFEVCGGACALIPAHVHQKLGFWNEDYGKYGYEDMEYSLRCRLAGLQTGYAPYNDRVRHMGYENMLADYEMGKKEQISANLTGEKMFVINKFLFEERIRNLKVDRRYLPLAHTNPVRFTSSRAYGGILKLQNMLQKNVDFEKSGDKIRLDLSRLRQETDSASK